MILGDRPNLFSGFLGTSDTKTHGERSFTWKDAIET